MFYGALDHAFAELLSGTDGRSGNAAPSTGGRLAAAVLAAVLLLSGALPILA